MKKRYGIFKSIVSTLLCASLLAPTAAAVMPALKAEAASKNTVVTYEYYTTHLGHEIPSSWLFVGTYLMSAKSLTAEMYQAALDSREYYNQTIAYYSSELDGGAWKNIEGASSITNILPVAEKVSEETLYPYLVSVVVDDDGIPKDPVTEEPIDIYTHISLYDMENIPELSALYEYYLSGDIGWEDEGSKNYLYRMLYFFFENDDLYYDRDSLDSSAAYEQYKTLVQDRTQLEKIWDQALTTTADSWPAEYKEIMTVMRNWPNIRDNVTDRADREEEVLNTLFMSLQQKEMTEEADAALYVERQIDAARRAQIYYNLTQNENLTGSYGFDAGEAVEYIQISIAELKARMAQLALDIDVAEAPLKIARSKVYELEDDNEVKEAEIDKEDARWEERKAEDELDGLNDELAVIQEEFAPVKKEYDRLNKELDEAVAEAQKQDNARGSLSSNISGLYSDKESKKKECADKIQEYKDNYDKLVSRSVIAESRRSEYEEALKDKEELEKQCERLAQTIETEKQKLEELKTEADSYTSSRTTEAADGTKIYDPAKKQDLDHRVSKQEKLIETLESSKVAVLIKLSDRVDVIAAIGPDLDLEEQIAQAKKAYEEAQINLPKLLDKELEEIDLDLADKMADYDTMSEPYQEALLVLKAANEAYDAYVDTYREAEQKLEDKKAQIRSVENEIKAHDNVIAALNDRITANKELIASKELFVEEAQIEVDTLNKDYEILAEELKGLNVLLDQTKTVSTSPYYIKIRAEELKITELKDRLSNYQRRKAELEKTDKELEDKETVLRAKAAELDKEAEEGLAEKYLIKLEAVNTHYDEMLEKLDKENDELNQAARDAVKDAQQRMRKDPAVVTLDRELIQASFKYDDGLAMATQAALYDDYYSKYPGYEADYKKALINYDNCKQSYLNASILKKGVYKRALDAAQTQLDRAETLMKNAKREYETAFRKLEEIKAKRTDYVADPSLSEYESAMAYANEWLAAYNDLDARLRETKAALEAEYEKTCEEWDEKKAEMESRIRNLQAAKEEEIQKLAEELESEQKSVREKASGFRQEADEITVKRAAHITELNDIEKEIKLIEAEINESVALVATYREKERVLKEGGNFGVAPTLKFLKDASVSGKPVMGRRYEDISAYAGMGGYVEIAEVTNLIQDAYTACMASYDAYVKKSMQRGETAADYTGYILSRRVAALAADEGAVLPYLQMIADLNHIEAGETVHAKREASLLYTWLLPFAISDFNDKRTTDSVDVYHAYLKEVTDRDSAENGIIYIGDRLEYAYSIKSSFVKDGKQDLIEMHILFLENLLAALKKRAGIEDDDVLPENKYDEIYEEYENAIDDNDLSRAKLIDALLQGLIERDKEDDDGIGSGNDNEDDIDPTEGDPSDRPKPETEISKVILDEVLTGDDEYKKDIDKLTALDGGLGDLADALDDSGLPDEYKNKISDAIANEYDGDSDTGSGSNTGTGSGEGSAANGGEGRSGGENDTGGDDGRKTGDEGYDDGVDKLKKGKVKDAVKPLFDGSAPEAQAAIVAALAEASQNTANTDLNDLAKELLDELMRNGNTFIYRQYMNDNSREYVSLAALDKCRRQSGFRYVRKGMNVTISQLYQGSASYIFTVGSSSMIKNNGEEITLKVNCVEQSDRYIRGNASAKYAYIDEDDSYKYTGCDCVYIKTTDWAVLITPGMQKTMKEVAEIMNEMAARGEYQ